MSFELTNFEFQLFLILTIIILVAKGLLIIYLGNKVIKKKKKTGKISLDFISCMLFLVICLFISRLLFVYFDFFLTKFDASVYYVEPNSTFWKLAMAITAIGLALTVYVVDRKVLNFKFKGIFSILTIIGAILILIYPVNTSDDFAILSGLSIITMIPIVILLLVFIYIGIKTPGLRKTSFIISIGGILYGIAVLIVNEAILTQLRGIFGTQIHITIFFLFMSFKIAGITLMSYGFTKFSI